MIKPSLRAVRIVALFLFALPVSLLGQAAVEYVLKSAGSSIFGSGSPAVAGCPVDSALLMCLSHAYPRATLFAAVVICLMILGWLYNRM